MLLHGVPSAGAWLLVAFSSDIHMLITGRLLVSFLNAVTLSCFNMYICEVSSPQRRGRLSATPEVFCSLGLLLGYAAGALTHWSFFAMTLGVVPNLIISFGFFWLPESPGWLTAHYQFDAAAASYHFYRGDEFQAGPEMEASLQRAEKNDKKGSILEVLGRLKQRETMLAVAITTGIFVMQILSGMLAVLSYAVSIFQLSGSGVNEYLCAVILGAVRLLSNILASAFADKCGRKMLLIISSLLSALGLAVLGGYFFLQQAGLLPSSALVSWVPVVALIVYVAAASFGIAPVTWMLLGELVPAAVGMVANGAILTVWGCVYFGVLQAFPMLTRALGPHGAFWLFAGCCVLLALFTRMLVPETRGVELQDVPALFKKRQKHHRHEEKQKAKPKDGRAWNLDRQIPITGNALRLQDARHLGHMRRRADSCTSVFTTAAAE